MSDALKIVDSLLGDDAPLDPKTEIDGMQQRDPHFGIPDIKNLDAFTSAYIEALFFTDEERLQQEAGTDELQISEPSLWKIAEECQSFQIENAEALGDDLARGGHDFWLTRNHHGVGFWDGDWPEEVAAKLTAAAHAYGESYTSADSEGNVYVD
jgi:predicted DNA-binding protein (UPF0251 family)